MPYKDREKLLQHRRDVYKKLVSERKCYQCRVPLPETCTTKKCDRCRQQGKEAGIKHADLAVHKQ